MRGEQQTWTQIAIDSWFLGAEACAVVVHHDRVRAVALRLTGLDGRWIVTRLSIG